MSEAYPDDMLWTIERRGAEGYVCVVLTTVGEIRSASVNGATTGAAHPLVAETVRDWDPPRRFVGDSTVLTGEVAVYDKVLTPEQMAAHWNAVQGV